MNNNNQKTRKQKEMKIAICGGGNAGYTIAAHIKLLHPHIIVIIYDTLVESLIDLTQNDLEIDVEGELEITGKARIDGATLHLKEAVDGASIIFCPLPAHYQPDVISELSQYIQQHQTVVLMPGRTGGVLLARKILAERNCHDEILVVETQTLSYSCRRFGNKVHVFGSKSSNECSGLPHHKMPQFIKQMQTLFGEGKYVIAKGGIWSTSLNNIGIVFHPAPTVLNLGWMESTHSFNYYHEGISPSIANLIEGIDRERMEVAKVLGADIPTAEQWLKDQYGSNGNDLYSCIQSTKAYEGIKAPHFINNQIKMDCRYIREDVPCGLVPLVELAEVCRVATPITNNIISLASCMWNIDFRKHGRTLKVLGLQGKSIDEIKAMA